MAETQKSVQEHYEGSGDIRGIEARLDQFLATLPAGPLSAAAFVSFDHFHVRGLEATQELAERAQIRADMKVLDAGSGLGGPSRYLAEHYGCQVTGVDLTPAFVHLSRLLTERAGLSGRLHYELGNLLELSFPDGTFDLVWTQHVVMNIRERDKLYAELRRVLKPGGRLVFFDIYAAEGKLPLEFPVPWAEIAENSYLQTESETKASLEGEGFAVTVWDDVTAATMAWFGEQARRQAAVDPSAAPSPQAAFAASLLGKRFQEAVMNLGRNAREGRVRWVMGEATAQG